MKLLHLVADPLPPALSVNKRVTASFIDCLQQLMPDLEIIEVDLISDPPPFFDIPLFRYLWQPFAEPDYQSTAAEIDAASYMLRHTQLLRESDVVVQSAPVWNYYVPAILKAWIDQVVSPGHLYEFAASGKQPLHAIQALVSVVSAGGWISKDATASSLLQLLHAPYHYAGIQTFHDIVIEAQEGSIYPDHAQREAQAVAMAQSLASELVITLRAKSD